MKRLSLQGILFSSAVSSQILCVWMRLTLLGCGRFFEGSAAEMHEALNKRLAALPDDTLVYVRSQTDD